MNGNLEPEENVMDDSVRYPGKMLGELAIALEKLGWEYGDEVDVEIGGTQVSGIDVGEEYNKKWQSPIGTANTIKMHSSLLRTSLVGT